MPCKCAVAWCTNGYQNKTGMLHGFPKDTEMRNLWIKACGRINNFNPKRGRVCSAHFREIDYERDLRAELMGYNPVKRLKKCAVPTVDCYVVDEVCTHINCSEELKTVSDDRCEEHPRHIDCSEEIEESSVDRYQEHLRHIDCSEEIEEFSADRYQELPPIVKRDVSTNTEENLCLNCKEMCHEMNKCKDALKALLKYSAAAETLVAMQKELRRLENENRILKRRVESVHKNIFN